MKQFKLMFCAGVCFTCILHGSLQAQSVSDYLILQDIGDFKFITETKDFVTGQVKTIPGYAIRTAPGILVVTNHFDLDHNDVTYETDYLNRGSKVSVEIQVTQHAGADSDRWLPHEVDMDFRNYYGIPGRSYGPRQIDGHTILEDAVGGRIYRWLSGNKVITIQYRDSQITRPEPIEVVRAYLAKHPSTLPPMKLVDLRSAENKIQWIKDEMERRLWLCDKWFLRLQTGKSESTETLRTVVKYLEIFLNYRERYYGIKAKDEMVTLVGYLDAKDGTSIKNKLSEYKTWWTVNKTRSISVP